MTERNQIWSAMRPHVAPYGHWTRVESPATGIGIPDLAYTVLGHSGWIENKLFEREDRASHLTLEQVLWAEEEVRAGGSWHLFGKCGPIWLLYDTPAARSILEGGSPSPIFRTTGSFPLKELLRVIRGSAP